MFSLNLTKDNFLNTFDSSHMTRLQVSHPKNFIYCVNTMCWIDNVLDTRDITLKKTDTELKCLSNPTWFSLSGIQFACIPHKVTLYNWRLDSRPELNGFVLVIGYSIIYKINYHLVGGLGTDVTPYLHLSWTHAFHVPDPYKFSMRNISLPPLTLMSTFNLTSTVNKYIVQKRFIPLMRTH